MSIVFLVFGVGMVELIGSQGGPPQLPRRRNHTVRHDLEAWSEGGEGLEEAGCMKTSMIHGVESCPMPALASSLPGLLLFNIGLLSSCQI